jgi:hypothetical protein
MPEPIRIARVPVDDGGAAPEGRVVPPRLDDAERDRVAAYLTAGAPILLTTALSPDVLDPARGKVVGASFRTDGTWVWSDALAYYVRVHGLAPEDDLLQWIRSLSYHYGAPDEATLDAALDALWVSFRS